MIVVVASALPKLGAWVAAKEVCWNGMDGDHGTLYHVHVNCRVWVCRCDFKVVCCCFGGLESYQC